MRGISTGWNTTKPYCSGITLSSPPPLSPSLLLYPFSLSYLIFIEPALNCHGARQMSPITLTETLALEFFH